METFSSPQMERLVPAVHENSFIQWQTTSNLIQYFNTKHQSELEVQKFKNTEDSEPKAKQLPIIQFGSTQSLDSDVVAACISKKTNKCVNIIYVH